MGTLQYSTLKASVFLNLLPDTEVTGYHTKLFMLHNQRGKNPYEVKEKEIKKNTPL